MQSCVVGVNKVTKMKANMADEPYTVDKGQISTWMFTLTYAKLDSFMPLAQEQLVMSRLPTSDRWDAMQCVSQLLPQGMLLAAAWQTAAWPGNAALPV